MFYLIVIAVIAVIALLVVACIVFYFVGANANRSQTAMVDLSDAQSEFERDFDSLQHQFFAQASESGKPRGLRWTQCEFTNVNVFARNKIDGAPTALAGVTISFEALEGGGMEDNPNVGNLRAGSAVFRHDGESWTTTGKAIFNLEPAEALAHLSNELE